MTKDQGRDVIIEFLRIGNSVKVTAVDAVSMVEVSIIGSPTASEEMLRRTAIKKLDYVMANRDAQK